MRTGVMALTVGLLAFQQDEALLYRFVSVKGTVTVTHAGVERRAAVHDAGVPGDGVRTGLFGRAVLEENSRRARFEILPSTRVRLGGSTPGVLVEVERGRLKAIFEALSETAERLVATPGALLAVRGTRYAVEVGADGSAALAVFEGLVEVRPHDPGFAVTRVQGGEMCRFGPQTPPRRSTLPRGVSEERWRGGLTGRQGGEGMGDGGAGTGAHRPGSGPTGRPSPPGKRGGGAP